MVLQTPTPPTPPTPPEIVVPDIPFWMSLPPYTAALITIVAIAAGVVVLWPIVRALARWIDGRTERRLGVPIELERLQHQVADLEGLQARVAELEERLDFAERMLTRQPEAAERLPRGSVP